MNVPDKNRLTRSVLIAAVIWSVLFVLLALLPVTTKTIKVREFSEVKISLISETPKQIRTASTTNEPVPAKVIEKPKPRSNKAAQKTVPAQKLPAKQKPASGLGIPNFSSTAGSSEPTAASGETLDFSSDRISERPAAGPSAPVREFEGSAAKVASTPDRPGSSPVEAGTQRTAASKETLNALERIEEGKTVGVSAQEQSTTTSLSPSSTASSATLGPITFDGAARRLLSPADPVIVLPPHLSRRIDSNRTVIVHFVVRADGTVPASLVTFTPSALLPPEIRDYLKNEFMSWRFERGKDDGQARFQYSITVQ
ncbi:MAG TPA: hypothetical protein GXZ47_01040 [Treponema sp.]|nr:hypothetical protein [Treponema sp.]